MLFVDSHLNRVWPTKTRQAGLRVKCNLFHFYLIPRSSTKHDTAQELLPDRSFNSDNFMASCLDFLRIVCCLFTY